MRAVALMLAALLWAAPVSAGPEFWKHEWPQTDFTKTNVNSWVEILSGGPPKDGIPAIDAPEFLKVAGERRIKGAEAVITLEMEGEAPRAYPVRYLMWHEIVNDTVGGVPVAVTFCPLCNSGITFDRRTDAGTLSFGVTGKLRNSDMIMFDRETESWWQQAVGEAIVGELTGMELKALPSWMESWDKFRARNPEGLVMAQPAFTRNYGANPYVGYDSLPRPFFYSGDPPPHGIPALARVVRVGERAWPLQRIRDEGGVREAGIILSWEAGQASALDAATVGGGRDVGTVRVRDASGRDLPHDMMFAFAFNAFWPEGDWMIGP
ncbi:DUF3179 domain-containing protein [Roseovarius sp. LXJ103]|uniref:DUF3179 domain-containing protein n=1 Tax=Roseovarius carneus TaxID=2853164 RepID=UPI000D608E4A|nr:DUF3179 domain-containing protein [Roseovarius carneus]MBZ8118532.1 DUF3179 domain-containing protein [Roseovarius carneus]PWE37276.1 hypothetical protein DD563_07280 [Pelagicola sp. LXJ1103]